jgi:hypothetical protein
VQAVQGVTMTMSGAPRAGAFDFTSPDVLSALMLVTLTDGTQLVAVRGNPDAGMPNGGAMALTIDAVTSEANDTRISGRLEVTLVNNDPNQATPTAQFEATF